MRTPWQASVLEHVRLIGPFTCAVYNDALLQQAQARNYSNMSDDMSREFRELDVLVDEGILCRARASQGIVYHTVDQCPLPYPTK